jgi:MFS family permease
MAVGLLVAAAGFVFAALVPGLAGLLPAAAVIGVGTGLATPLGFASLAAATPRERLGQTMGSAEVGREIGDAGGPLLVGAVAAGTSTSTGLLVLAVLVVVVAVEIGPRPSSLARPFHFPRKDR